jgi:hypothetical protein
MLNYKKGMESINAFFLFLQFSLVGLFYVHPSAQSEDFEAGSIKLSVFDADSLSRNDLIGSVSLDATYVYAQPGHELWKAWVGLVNDQDPTDDGVQGYLRFSVSVVGPNDKVVVHKDDEEDDEGGGKANGKDVGSLVLIPPTVKLKKMWLVVAVHHAEYLPKMDASGLTGVCGVDAYFAASFGDMKRPFRTKVVTVKGKSRAMLNPPFNQVGWKHNQATRSSSYCYYHHHSGTIVVINSTKNYLANQPFLHSTNQPTNHLTNRPTDQPTNVPRSCGFPRPFRR